MTHQEVADLLTNAGHATNVAIREMAKELDRIQRVMEIYETSQRIYNGTLDAMQPVVVITTNNTKRKV